MKDFMSECWRKYVHRSRENGWIQAVAFLKHEPQKAWPKTQSHLEQIHRINKAFRSQHFIDSVGLFYWGVTMILSPIVVRCYLKWYIVAAILGM